MTESDQSDDIDSTANHDTDGDVGRIHREMAAAGIRLNEAHSHLSALHRAAENPDTPDELVAAEADGVVKSLQKTRKKIDSAIDAAEQRVDDIDDSPTETGDQSDDTSDSEAVPEVLWNTGPIRDTYLADPDTDR